MEFARIQCAHTIYEVDCSSKIVIIFQHKPALAFVQRNKQLLAHANKIEDVLVGLIK